MLLMKKNVEAYKHTIGGYLKRTMQATHHKKILVGQLDAHTQRRVGEKGEETS